MELEEKNPLLFLEKEMPIYNVYRAYKTVCEMFNDRKYGVSKDLLDMSFEKFKEEYLADKEIDFEMLEISLDLESVFVKWCIDEKPGTNYIKKCFNSVKENKKRLIIITQNKFTAQANIALTSMKKLNYNIEIFSEDELYINITKHILQPQYTRLNNEEKKKILELFAVNINNLPIMKTLDPISRYYNFKRGDVVKIIINRGGKKDIEYRGVI